MKILWIDDEADVLFLCSAILGKHGHKVYTLQSSKNIMNTISETHPDVILLDHWMPDITGLELTKQLKHSRFAHIPIIMCTSNPEMKDEAKKAGAEYFINKPFTIEQIENMIAKAVHLGNRNNAA